jgi:hypothetical protein
MAQYFSEDTGEIEEQFYDTAAGFGVGGKVDVYSNEAKHVVENCERDNAERKYNEESAVCDQCS